MKFQGLSSKLQLMLVVLVLAVFALALGGAKTAQASGLQKAPNNLGLVAYWSFEDGAGTQATDFSGNGNTGTFGGAPTWIKGKFGNALQFVANSQSVSNSSFVAPTTAITVSAWVYGNDFSNGDPSGLVTKATGWSDTTGFALFNGYNSVSDPVFAINGVRADAPNGTTSNGVWYHLVGTYDKVNIKLYVNGVEKASVAYSSDISTNSEPLRVSNWSSFQSFKADEVRIYNRVLSATEVAALYNAGGIAKSNSSLNNFMTNGLVGVWSFDGVDISGTTAYDRSGSANNGTFNNSPLPIKGKIGQALNFSGTNNVTLGSSLNQTSGSYSVSTWLKPSSFSGCDNSGDGCIFINQNSGVTQGDFWFGFTSQGILTAVFVENGPTTVTRRVDTGGTIAVPGEWYHVVIARSSIGPTYALYINGVSQPLTTFVTGSGSGGTYIGTELAGNSTYSFRGIIDDMRLYNRALSSAEVTQLYNLGGVTVNKSTVGGPGTSGLVLWHTFDGPKLNTTTSTDSSGNANNGTLTNGPVPTRGKIGQALSFDGSNDYVNLGTPISQSDPNLTVSAWVKTNNPSVGGPVLMTDGFIVDINIASDNLIKVTKWGVVDVFVGPYPADTNWHHLAIVYSSSGITAYIDGVAGAVTSGNTSNFSPASRANQIGHNTEDSGGSRYFNGLIDDVRVYNRALSVSQVKQLYNLGK